MNAIKQGYALTAFLALVAALISMAGCSSAYYGAMEKIGIEKRDILIDRIDSVEEVAEMEKSIAEAERFVQSMK